MINDYEIIEHDEHNDIIVDKSEYYTIIKDLYRKNNNLEIINKTQLNELNNLNKKYINSINDLDNLNHNYLQLEKDLYDMELVNLELINIIKKNKLY